MAIQGLFIKIKFKGMPGKGDRLLSLELLIHLFQDIVLIIQLV